jgi:hypothetical protein
MRSVQNWFYHPHPFSRLLLALAERLQVWELTQRQCCGTVTIFYGSGSNFLKVPVLVPTFAKLRFRFRIFTIKSNSFKKEIITNLAFLHSKLFYKEKIDKFHKIHNIILCVFENFGDTILLRFQTCTGN